MSLAVDGKPNGAECLPREADASSRARSRNRRQAAGDAKSAATIARPAIETAAVAAAWRRLDAWLERNGLRIPRLAAPATKAALANAAAAHHPPSLRAVYAAHDGSDEAELLGLGRVPNQNDVGAAPAWPEKLKRNEPKATESPASLMWMHGGAFRAGIESLPSPGRAHSQGDPRRSREVRRERFSGMGGAPSVERTGDIVMTDVSTTEWIVALDSLPSRS